MDEITLRYMTVTADVVPNGMNLSMWMSTVEFYMSEVFNYPYQYTYMGESCTWIMHANMELTGKIIAAIGEQADRICIQQERAKAKRLPVNRR